MKRFLILVIACAFLTGCTAYEEFKKGVSGTGGILSNIMSGGKVKITLGIEPDAAYNDTTEPQKVEIVEGK